MRGEDNKMKQTEIGMIPDDWEVKRLGDVANNFTGLTYSPENTKEFGTLVLRSSNIQNGMLSFGDNVYVNMDVPERAIAHTGDILICVRNGSKALIGKSALITESANNCAFGAFMTILRTEILNQHFLFYLWQSDLIQKQIQESMGATINQITNKDINHYFIAYPKSKFEQKKIAQVLSDVDSVIATLEKLIAKKKNIKQGAMQQLLTGKKRLPGFAKSDKFKQTEIGLIPVDWEVRELGSFCKIKDGTHGTFNRLDNGCLLLSAKNILDGKLEILENESRISETDYNSIVNNGFPKMNDILVSCVGTIGRCCIFKSTEKIAFQRSVTFIRQSVLDNHYFMYFIQSEIFQNQLLESVNASTLGGVYLGAFLPLNIFYPSSQPEQTAIANVLSDMDREIEMLDNKLAKYRDLKTGMMQQLLTGRIRLRKY